MKSIIIGAGTYGEVYLHYLKESGVNVIGFLDDNPKEHGKVIAGVEVLGSTSLMNDPKNLNCEAIYCPIGNNKIRVDFLRKAKKLGYKTPNFIHNSVIISPNVSIGDGVYILPGSIIMPSTIIKDFCMISMGVKLAHHNILDEGVFLSTGCNFGASIHARSLAYCGIGSTIMTGISFIGHNCLIGAGAVVINNVPDNAVMAGVPAKILRYK